MSNIVLRGDVIQDLGEYLPNVYIEGIQVVQALPVERPQQIELIVNCSVLFLVSDDYDVADLTTTIQQVSIHALILSSAGKQLKKQTIIDRMSLGSTTNDEIYTLDNGDTISDRIAFGDYQDDLYDEEDRRIVKVSFYRTVLVDVDEGIERGNVYLYVFSSIFGKTKISETSSNLVYLNTSNIAYEKLFSPGLNVLREEEVIYVGSQGEKYGQVPILGLNRNFYKTENVTREDIISKVNALVKRFEGRTIGPLSDSVDSIKNVLSKEADTENLLVQLDKVRRSFPNKTNNNPVGNLYAAFAVLLRNINSAFRPADMVKKEKYLTGKVIDKRVTQVQGSVILETEPLDQYIPEDLFFLHRERISEDETSDIAVNRGMFSIRYEEMLKRESNIAGLIDINKLYETMTGADLVELKRMLFSYFRVTSVYIEKGVYEDNELRSLQQNNLAYGLSGTDRMNRTSPPQLVYFPYNDRAVEEVDSTLKNTLKENNFAFNTPNERMLSYQIVDIDSYTALYEANQIERYGSMRFAYYINASFYDDTQEFAQILVDKFNEVYDDFKNNYFALAEEICSFNNIDNRFNNFFVNSIMDNYPSGVYPWETAPAIYAIMVYILNTDQFETFEDAVRYSRGVAATISPQNGNLQSLQDFEARMTYLKEHQINDLQGRLFVGRDEPDVFQSIFSKDIIKDFELIPFNYTSLISEREAEFESLFGSSLKIYNEDIVTAGGVIYDLDGSTTGPVPTVIERNSFMRMLLDELGKFYDGYATLTLDAGVSIKDYMQYRSLEAREELGKVIHNFIESLQVYFRTLRNTSLEEVGLGEVFNFGRLETRTINDPAVRNILNAFITENFAVFSSINPDSTSPNIGSVENLVIPIVNLIYNYYLGVPMTAANRVNLQYDISVQDFINLGTSGELSGNASATEIYLLIIDSAIAVDDPGALPTYSGVYTGPDIDEIANIDDISF